MGYFSEGAVLKRQSAQVGNDPYIYIVLALVPSFHQNWAVWPVIVFTDSAVWYLFVKYQS